ncbi:hypothetical protein, partial [Thermus sp.]|uniref:hypothetical protein n=1 Tax=Thermus sp. TaxID=275 RepID=UPI0025E8F8E3
MRKLWPLVLLWTQFPLGLAQMCPSQDATVTGTQVLNSYYGGSAVPATLSAGSTQITLSGSPQPAGAPPIQAGDLILIIQMQGATLNCENNNRYGDGQGNGTNQGTRTGDYAGGW